MKPILSRLACLGIVAAGALGASVATSWSCAPGSTDCPLGGTGPTDFRMDRAVRPDFGAGRPDWRSDVRPGRPDWRPDVRPGRPDWRPDADRGRHEWRADDGGGRPRWRPDRDNRPRFDRHRPPRDYPDRWRDKGWRYWPNGGIYLNFDIDRYMPDYYDYYYDDPRPRYRVRLSVAHIEWCHARYRTYRVSDNTFKPTRHTRRQCISPYS